MFTIFSVRPLTFYYTCRLSIVMPFPSHTTTRTALITSRIKFSSALNRIIDSGFGFYSASATWVMGKVKFRKLKSLRHNPVDLPSADELSRVEVAEDSLPDQNAPVLSKVRLKKVLLHASTGFYRSLILLFSTCRAVAHTTPIQYHATPPHQLWQYRG